VLLVLTQAVAEHLAEPQADQREGPLEPPECTCSTCKRTLRQCCFEHVEQHVRQRCSQRVKQVSTSICTKFRELYTQLKAWNIPMHNIYEYEMCPCYDHIYRGMQEVSGWLVACMC
jgi:hypothetical protein